MTQDADTGECAHKTGTDTVATAADAGRRGAVVITITYTVDSAVATITLSAVVSSAGTMNVASLTQVIAAVAAANPTAYGGLTAPTVSSIQDASIVVSSANLVGSWTRTETFSGDDSSR